MRWRKFLMYSEQKMSNIYQNTSENIAKAAEIIKNGGLVAFPTETVYGLGDNVYNSGRILTRLFLILRKLIF